MSSQPKRDSERLDEELLAVVTHRSERRSSQPGERRLLLWLLLVEVGWLALICWGLVRLI
jgi:hypothetical protein